jgi:hypothetical protein
MFALVQTFGIRQETRQMSTMSLVLTAGQMDAMMDASSSALLVMMIPCASDLTGLATVTNHLNNSWNIPKEV